MILGRRGTAVVSAAVESGGAPPMRELPERPEEEFTPEACPSFPAETEEEIPQKQANKKIKGRTLISEQIRGGFFEVAR